MVLTSHDYLNLFVSFGNNGKVTKMPKFRCIEYLFQNQKIRCLVVIGNKVIGHNVIGHRLFVCE